MKRMIKKSVLWIFVAVICTISVSVFGQENNNKKFLLGKWTLTKIEIIQEQNKVGIDTLIYTVSNYPEKIYFEKINFQSNGLVIYGGIGDKALLSQPGLFHTHTLSNTGVVFQNPLIGFTFDFFWENEPTLFVLEKTVHISQQGNLSNRIRFFYQQEE